VSRSVKSVTSVTSRPSSLAQGGRKKGAGEMTRAQFEACLETLVEMLSDKNSKVINDDPFRPLTPPRRRAGPARGRRGPEVGGQVGEGESEGGAGLEAGETQAISPRQTFESLSPRTYPHKPSALPRLSSARVRGRTGGRPLRGMRDATSVGVADADQHKKKVLSCRLPVSLSLCHSVSLSPCLKSRMPLQPTGAAALS
jgi:hypothetical protein